MASLREDLSNVYQGYLSETNTFNKSAAFERRSVKLSANFQAVQDSSIEMVPANSIQSIIRPLFGKTGILAPSIGDHPDFLELHSTRQHVFCDITTLFMDIESSTRLSLVYPLEQVYRIKNSFIRAAIEVIKSFDGHVHRIMGDAVMAYFGGKHVDSETSIINGINCAAALRYLTERIVAPILKGDYGDEFAIRIGLDYGPKEKVLWSSYGYPNMNEITATSFYVDIASKLQQAARRNQIMIGHSLKSQIDFPEILLAVKEISEGGKLVRKPYVEPNHTDKQGHPINYLQYEFKWKDYLLFTPFADKDTEFFGLKHPFHAQLDVEVHDSKFSTTEGRAYFPCEGAIPKNKWLKYRIKLPYVPQLPYSNSFSVENHGLEAQADAGVSCGNHTTPYQVQTQAAHRNLHNWEHTSYRGLHYMTIEINTGAGKRVVRCGIYIK